MPVFALVDCNNFYAFCEKLFEPKLIHTPVVVLSNNDGCVVARSAEVKALGIPMGVPWFKIKEQAKQHGIVAFSSNYALYADMSNRVVTVLSQFSPHLEVYSIDESFLELSEFATVNLSEYAAEIRQRVVDWLGLTVCVGIGASKTLAKLANHCAKKSLAGANGVCDLTAMSSEEVTTLMERIPVGEIWGVGRKITAKLEAMGIRTVRQLRDAECETIRRRFSVVLERTVCELRGTSCLELEEVAANRQQIISSRSFGEYVYQLPDLETAVATYIGRAAEKLRSEDGLAGALTVYIRTNPFSEREPQYQKTLTVPLPEATADTRVLVLWGLRVLKNIFRPGYAYQKAGVMLSDIRPRLLRQGSLLVTGNTESARRVMQTMDAVNRRWGRGVLRVAAEGLDKPWQMKRGKLSPRYTTSWRELAVVKAR